jgi:hypothetical protein
MFSSRIITSFFDAKFILFPQEINKKKTLIKKVDFITSELVLLNYKFTRLNISILCKSFFYQL